MNPSTQMTTATETTLDVQRLTQKNIDRDLMTFSGFLELERRFRPSVTQSFLALRCSMCRRKCRRRFWLCCQLWCRLKEGRLTVPSLENHRSCDVLCRCRQSHTAMTSHPVGSRMSNTFQGQTKCAEKNTS